MVLNALKSSQAIYYTKLMSRSPCAIKLCFWIF